MPNLSNFKDALKRKALAQKEALEQKEKRNKQKEESRKIMHSKSSVKPLTDLTKLASDAAERSLHFNIIDAAANVNVDTLYIFLLLYALLIYEKEDEGIVEEDMREHDAGNSNRRTYFKQLKEVIKSADVILEVLDARDPMGCRAKVVEAR